MNRKVIHYSPLWIEEILQVIASRILKNIKVDQRDQMPRRQTNSREGSMNGLDILQQRKGNKSSTLKHE